MSFILSVANKPFTLSVVKLNVVMLSVVVPKNIQQVNLIGVGIDQLFNLGSIISVSVPIKNFKK